MYGLAVPFADLMRAMRDLVRDVLALRGLL
jgi:hypothetical protein